MIKNILTILITLFSNIEDKLEKVGLYINELLNIEENLNTMYPYLAWEGWVNLTPVIAFFCDNSKLLELESSNFLAFLTNSSLSRLPLKKKY